MADAERESQDCDGGEAVRFSQHARAIANVLQQRFEEADSARVAKFLFDLIVAADG
jgi:ATP-dependent DNA ligase